MKPSHKERNEEKEKVDNIKSEEREELDFQFDEELDTPPPTGRHNAFSEWFVATLSSSSRHYFVITR